MDRENLVLTREAEWASERKDVEYLTKIIDQLGYEYTQYGTQGMGRVWHESAVNDLHWNRDFNQTAHDIQGYEEAVHRHRKWFVEREEFKKKVQETYRELDEKTGKN